MSMYPAPRVCRRCGIGYTAYVNRRTGVEPKTGICPSCSIPRTGVLRDAAPSVKVPDLSAGLCFGADDDTWYPLDGDVKAIKYAVDVCRMCPVREICEKYALDADEPAGVWGAATHRDRVRMKMEGRAS